jgi:histidine triad (HIT) family protein
MAGSCVFCRIARGEIPARLAFQDEAVVAFHDLNPQAPTHVLVVPREHIPSADAMGAEHGELLAAMLVAAQRVARDVGAEARGYRLVFNHGPDAGQSVDHVHLHVLAGRKLGWPPG